MEKNTHYQGKRVSYTIEGNGYPLVFIHGYLEYKNIWTNFTKHFLNKYKLITIDMPGHGDTEVFRSVHTMKEMAQLVKYVMAENHIFKATIIGHSMGGYITLALVDYFPEVVDAFVLFSSSTMNDSREKKELRDREIELVKSGKKDLIINTNIPNTFAQNNIFDFKPKIKEIKNSAKKMKERGITASLEGMKNRVDYLNRYKMLTIPSLFIAGRYDNLIPIHISEKQVEKAQNAQFVILENSGHMGYIEEEKVAAKHILSFLEKQDL